MGSVTSARGASNPAGVDVFQRSTTAIIGAGAAFADDRDLFHRKDAVCHCGTAAKRDPFTFDWWEKAP